MHDTQEATIFNAWSAWIACLFLVVCAFLGLAAGAPEEWAPVPALTVFSVLSTGAVLGDGKAFLGLLWPAAIFVAWSWPVIRGDSGFPQRSLWLLFVLTALSVWHFTASYQSGIEAQGLRHVVVVALLNVVIVAMLFVLTFRIRRHPSRNSSLVLHALLFGWLAWGAFPWLGTMEF